MKTSGQSPKTHTFTMITTRNKLYLQISTVLALAILFVLTQLAGAAANTWNNAAGGYWSVPGNWSSGVPGTTSDVIFGNTGAGASNTNDISSETIDSLVYNQNNGLQQTTVINPGQTLTFASSVAAGNFELYAGNTGTTVGEQVPAAIQGLNSTLTMTGLGDIWSAQGATGNGTQDATLDLSGLGTLNASIGRLLVGVNVNGVNRMAGIVKLAQTNNLVFTGGSPQVEVGEATANGNSGSGSANTVLSFGQTNNLFADTMRFGGDKCNVAVNFAAAINAAPTLIIRNSDGASPCTVIDFGYANGDGGTGTTETFAADFSAGSIDLLANLVHMPQGQPGLSGTSESGGATATVTLGAGTFSVADLEIGFGNSTSSSSTGNTTGTLNLDNNGLFASGPTVICSTVLDLAHTNGGSGATVISGTINIGNDGNAGDVVIANAITSGGGVSTINLKVGTLVVSNTMGSLAFPISAFSVGSLGAAILDIPLSSSGAPAVVKTFTTGGASTINITAIPGIATYPATFAIIQYQGAEGGAGPGTFMLNLPAGYAGTIGDTGNGVVQVTLTSGPIAVLATTWTGATDNNWDLITPNWLYQGVAADFVNGRATIFNDSTTQTNLLLDGALSPSSIAMTNNLKKYTFGGSGNIAGAASLIKSGSSSLTLDNTGGNNNIPTVIIGAGTLQIGAGDANGGLSAVNITNNGALVVDRTDNVTLSSDISGSGTLTQGGGGTLILSGANTYNGATSLTNGTLEIDQTSSGTGPVNTSSGTVLSGLGVVNGTVTVGGNLSPGSSTLPGNFQANAGLTLSAGSTLNFGLSATDTSTSDNANDSVVVTGNLAANNNTINVNFAGTPQSGNDYTLFTYTTSSGSFNPTITGTHFAVSLDTVSTPGSVLLDVTGTSGFNLEWNSTSSSTWDTATANWLNLANSTPSTFASGDTVLFGDNSVQTLITIGAGVTVYPSVITNNSVFNNFTINGAGGIGGSASIVKSGGSTLVIDTANSFTGTVDIQGGTLQTANPQALGSATSTTVENGATLDIDGQNLGAAAITASGSGVSGQGAIINSGAADLQAFRTLVLAGDTTIGGSGEIEMNNSGGAASLSTGGSPYNLTKVGANILNFQNLATFDTALANIDIQGGTLLFNGLTPGMGDPTFTNTVELGATLAFGTESTAWGKQFVFNGDGTTINLNNEGGATTELDGPVLLNGDVVFSVGGTSLTITNTVSGPGGIIKNGASPMILTGPTTYTGDTTINTAALRLAGSADLSGSSNIIVNAGATLTLTGLVSQTITLPSGHSLKGNGVVSGFVTASAGSTVSPAVTPGASPVGTLTVSNAITLSGTTVIQLDPVNATNDVLKSGLSTITYGGTLSLTNLSAYSAGNSFQIFSALNSSSYLGSFANITPATPGAGLAWNTSALNTSGTITVVSAVTTPVKFNSIAIVGGNVVLGGSNGVPNNHYIVTTSTNLALKLKQLDSDCNKYI